ncbi:MAG: Gfo/Idh/MocA family oxidoreductase [Clostridia bacterium]|nr:Gfo/Idh/MocA family oxidoreductase [Clostridia bacterium]
MFKVAIIGAGNIATNAHVPAYAELTDRVKIAAVVDINLDRAKEIAKKLGDIPAFDSTEEMLKKVDVDYVDICTWNGGHAPVAMAAAKAGKAILCEKPMSDSLEHSLAMAEAVKAAKVPFMMAMVTRYSKEAQYVHELQEAGGLGEVYFAKTAYTRRRGTPVGWFTDKKKSGGGPVIDLGVHCIDRSWFLMGKPTPVTVSACANKTFGDFKTKGVDRWCAFDKGDGTFDVEDNASAYVRFANGAALSAEISWAQNGAGESFVNLFGTKAGVSFDPLTIHTEDEAGYLTDNKPDMPNSGFGAYCFTNEIAHFLDCLETGKQPMSTLEDGVMLQRILDGIYRSAKEGKEVTV